jgi:hypothetical protein
MSRSLAVRLLGALFVMALTVVLSAAGPVSAGASSTDKPSTPAAARGGAGARSLPAGAAACRSTAAKPSSSTATCRTAPASAAAPATTVSLPGGAIACASSAAKRSAATAACTSSVAPGPNAPLAAFAVTLGASPLALVPGGTTTLTATSNQDVGPTPWFIEIFDSTTGAFLTECGSGTTCSTSVTQGASTIQNYIAYISSFSTAFPPPNIQANSAVVTVSWLTVGLVADTTALLPGGTVTLTASTTADVGPTPFFIEIFDVTSGAQVAICGGGTTCATSVTQGSTVRTYVAYVARFTTTLPPPDVRGQSAGVLVSWISVGLSASAVSLPAGSSVILTAGASLDVGPTPFFIEIFDLTSNTQVAICGAGTACSGSVTQNAPTLHAYIAFVAGFGTALPPPNVRAGSNTAFVSWV